MLVSLKIVLIFIFFFPVKIKKRPLGKKLVSKIGVLEEKIPHSPTDVLRYLCKLMDVMGN